MNCNSKKKVLCVGLCCLDVVCFASTYPEEDSDQRCLDLWKQRGGNASNNCTTLSSLGTCCEFLGTIGAKPDSTFLLDDFRAFAISVDNCVIYDEHSQNTACVTICKDTGTRTILFHKTSMPELNATDFENVSLDQYKWIHFEGRSNIEEICKMIGVVREWNESHIDKITISVEIEKSEKKYEEYLDKGDVVFASKDFAQLLGFKNMEEAATQLANRIRPRATIVCPWGEKGACAVVNNESKVYSSPAYSPAAHLLVNTLGAGDAFNASVIHALCRGKHIGDAIQFACHLAGEKCGALKPTDLKELCNKYKKTFD